MYHFDQEVSMTDNKPTNWQFSLCIAFVRQADSKEDASEFISEVESGEMGVPQEWGKVLWHEADKKFNTGSPWCMMHG